MALSHNCQICERSGIITEAEHWVFPENMKHYFAEKLCTFHYWMLEIGPAMSWEEYLKRCETEGRQTNMVVTLPSKEFIDATLRRTKEIKKAPPPEGVVEPKTTS